MLINQKIVDLKKFCSDSDNRPILKGVLFKENKAIATDAIRLIEVEAKDGSSVSEPIILNLSDIKAKKNEIVDVPTDTGNRIAGEFPHYTEIIPQSEPVHSIKINGELFSEMLKYMHQFQKDGVTIEFRDEYAPLVIKAENDEHKVLGLIMGIKR